MRTQWPIAQLSEVCHFQNGYPFKNSDYVGEGDGAFEIFRMGNIRKGGGFNPDGKKALVAAEQAATLRRFLLNKGDILMCMTDMKANVALLGHTARMPVSGRYLVNQRVGRITVRKPEALDQHFLYYYSNSPAYIGWLRSHANSGVQVNLSTEAILNSPIACPPLPIQRRIASILSAYDDLIENSQRRIKILETMARALYREWFVHFRFPGHENHPRVASPLGEIPEGWELMPIQHFGKVITGKTPSKANSDFFGDDVPFVKTPDMHGNLFILGTSERLSVAGAASQANKTLPAGAIFVSCIGTIGVVSIATEDCQTNQQINALVPKNEASREFLYLRLQDAKQTLENLGANGATMGNVNKGKFEAVEILAPCSELLAKYHRMAQPMFEDILAMSRQIQNLRRTRDLLLPRLLSGQIDVEQLPEPALQEVS
ncbi:MAG: restriction endonuclease subunit S [Cyanobacteriota bacterium]